MRTFDEIRLLGDQVLVRCLGTADKQGSIHIPASAQEGRKIHQSGGDYLHRGQVVKVGPGDKLVAFACEDWQCPSLTWRIADRLWPATDPPTNIASAPKCRACGSATFLLQKSYVRDKRADMPVSVGDVVLYENRRDAKLQPRRFPSLGLDEDAYVILLAEQHVLAVIE